MGWNRLTDLGFHGFPWISLGSKALTRLLQGLRKVFALFLQGFYKCFTSFLQGCYRVCSRLSQGICKVFTRLLQGCDKVFTSRLQGCFYKVLTRNFKKVFYMLFYNVFTRLCFCKVVVVHGFYKLFTMIVCFICACVCFLFVFYELFTRLLQGYYKAVTRFLRSFHKASTRRLEVFYKAFTSSFTLFVYQVFTMCFTRPLQCVDKNFAMFFQSCYKDCTRL